MVTWSKRSERTISQQTFDEAVGEIIDELELSLPEAIIEARSQFEAQGVSLVGIRDTIIGEEETPAITTILDDLDRSMAERNTDAVVRLLTAIGDDQARDLADAGLIGALLYACDRHIQEAVVIDPALGVLQVAVRSTRPSAVPEPGLLALLRCLRHHLDHLPIQISGRMPLLFPFRISCVVVVFGFSFRIVCSSARENCLTDRRIRPESIGTNHCRIRAS